MSVLEIAQRLERSPAWVSVRIGILAQMSEVVKKAIFSGNFPVRSFMYTLRQFTRVKQASKSEVDDFVKAVAGKKLSTRSVDHLARGFFLGGDSIRDQIKNGNIAFSLEQMKQISDVESDEHPGLNEFEIRMIRDLEIAQKYMARIVNKYKDPKLENAAFFAEASFLSEGILRQIPICLKAIDKLYDRCREKKDHLGFIQAREGKKGNSSLP